MLPEPLMATQPENGAQSETPLAGKSEGAKNFVSPTGIEPATFGTGNRCSNPLSYGDIAGKIPNDVILAHRPPRN